jgi:hypothetical protein
LLLADARPLARSTSDGAPAPMAEQDLRKAGGAM